MIIGLILGIIIMSLGLLIGYLIIKRPQDHTNRRFNTFVSIILFIDGIFLVLQYLYNL